MKRKLSTDGERGVSEIYGTILIISLVVVTAIVVIGMGALAFNNMTDDTDDDLVRQSVVEFDDRLDSITEVENEDGTVIEFPDGTGEEIDTETDHGTVNITVETNSTYWEATDPEGGLVAHENQTNSTTIPLGTLSHESDDGVITAYQGGAVFEKQDGNVKVISPPDIYAENDTLDLSFVDISSIDHVQEGNELRLQNDPESSLAEQANITRVIEKQMRSSMPDGMYTSSANITVNITGDFAQGWANYSRSNMDTKNVEFHSASDIPGDRDKVEIELGTYGEGLENVPEAPEEFDDDVVYTGLSEFASDLYNDGPDDDEWTGNITNDDRNSYTVQSPNSTVNKNHNHTVGILYETRGNGPEWWAWDGSKWLNVEDPHAEPLDTSEVTNSSDGELISGDPNAGQFNISHDTWSCVVVTEEPNNPDGFRDFVPNETEYDDSDSPYDPGCLKTPVGVDVDEGWEDYVGNFKTDFQIDDIAVKIIHENGTILHDDDGSESLNPSTDRLKPGWEVELSVDWTNEGYRDAEPNEMPVGLTYEANTNEDNLVDTPWLKDGITVGTAEGQTKGHTFNFEIDPADQAYHFVVGTGTKHDAKGMERKWEVIPDTESEFNITGLSVDDSGKEEGDNVTAEIDVENTGSSNDTQEVFLWGEEEGETLINTTEVELNDGEETTKEITWTTEENRESKWENVTARAPLSDDDETEAIEVEPKNDDPPEFLIEAVEFNGTELESGDLAGEVEEGDEAVVTVDIENDGEQTGIQQIELDRDGIDDNDTARTNSTTVEIEEDDDGEATLAWQTIPGDAAEEPYTLTVETDDDTFEFDLDVIPRTDGSNFQIDIEDYPEDGVTAGSDVFINGTITNEGENDTQTAYLQSVGVPDQTELELESGDTKPFNLSWETSGKDVGEHEVSVLTDDDIESRNVTVFEKDAGEAEFDVDVEETNSPVTEGEPLTVDINVTNTGSGPGSTVVALKDFDDQFVNVTQSEIALDSGQSWEGTLTWYTLVGLVDGDDPITDDITVDADGTDATDTETVTIEPREATRKPAEVVFAIDETGSMEWEDPDEQRVTAIETALGAMNDTLDRAAALEFDTEQSFHHEMTDNLDAINESLETNPSGSTNIGGGMEAAFDHLSEETGLEVGDPDPEREQVVILLTDGQHNSPESCYWVGWNYVCEPVPEYMPTNVAEEYNMSNDDSDAKPLDASVYTVGFGGANEDQLREVSNVAGNGKGNFTWADNPEELAGIFEGLIDDITDEQEPELDINSAEADPDTVAEGETVYVETEVENAGEGIGDVPVTLLDWEGNPVDSTLLNLSSAGLEPGETADVNLSWDTTGILDDGDRTDELTVVTSGNEETVDVTVEDRSAFFEVDVNDVSDEVEEGEVVNFDVDVENTADAPETQTVWVEYQDQNGNNKTVATSEPIQLDPGEEENVDIDWQTGIGDSAIEEVRVRSEDNTETADVEIEKSEVEEAEFAVDIEETNDPVTIGEKIEVTAKIANENGSDEEFPAQVQLIVDGKVVDSQIVSLSEGDSTEETFVWWADEADEDIPVTVEAKTPGDDSEDDTEVDVEEINDDEETFEVDDVDTNSNEGVSDPITTAETLEVDTWIENTGEANGSQKLTIKRNDSGISEPIYIKTIDTGTIPTGDIEDFSTTLSAGEFTADTEEIMVETENNDTYQPIDIESADDTDIEIEINKSAIDATEQPQAVDAGEPITVPIEVKNNGDTEIKEDQLFLRLQEEFNSNTTANFTSNNGDTQPGKIDPEDKEPFKMVWDTTGKGSDDEGRILVVRVEDAEPKSVEVYVNEVEGQVPGGPGFGDDGSGIGIDIDDIEVAG